MAETYEFREGRTSTIAFRLTADGVNDKIQGKTITLEAYKADLATKLIIAGTVSNQDDGTEQKRGLVHYTPHANDLKKADGPLRCRFASSDGIFWPSGAPDIWIIYFP